MKWIAIILLGCTVPASFAEVLVQENFEGTTFPPAGWTTYSGGYGLWSGTWSRVTEADNHFARGQCNVFSSSSGGRILLFTPYLSLSAGSVLSISFNGVWDCMPYPTGINFYLYDHKISIWYGFIPADGRFKKRTYNPPPVPFSGNYRVGWMSYCDNYSAAYGRTDLDNVLITTVQKETNNVEPSSLGRIKSAYK